METVAETDDDLTEYYLEKRFISKPMNNWVKAFGSVWSSTVLVPILCVQGLQETKVFKLMLMQFVGLICPHRSISADPWLLPDWRRSQPGSAGGDNRPSAPWPFKVKMADPTGNSPSWDDSGTLKKAAYVAQQYQDKKRTHSPADPAQGDDRESRSMNCVPGGSWRCSGLKNTTTVTPSALKPNLQSFWESAVHSRTVHFGCCGAQDQRGT